MPLGNHTQTRQRCYSLEIERSFLAKRAQPTLLLIHSLLIIQNIWLCTPSLRLIPTAWKPSTIPSFQPYLRGACHGLYALFLPVSAGRACMAVRHASLGVAQRLRHCVSDD